MNEANLFSIHISRIWIHLVCVFASENLRSSDLISIIYKISQIVHIECTLYTIDCDYVLLLNDALK